MMMLPNLEPPKMLGSGRDGGRPGISERSLSAPGTTPLSCLSSLTSASILPSVTALAAPVSSTTGTKETSASSALGHPSIQQSPAGVHPPHASASCPSHLTAADGTGLSSSHLSSAAPSLMTSFQPLQTQLQAPDTQSHGGQDNEAQSGPSSLAGGGTSAGGALSTASGHRPASSSLSVVGPALTSAAVFAAQPIPASLVLSARQHSRPPSGPCGPDASGVPASGALLTKLEEAPNNALGRACLAPSGTPVTAGANSGSSGTAGKAPAVSGPAGPGTLPCPLTPTGCGGLGCSLQPGGGGTSSNPPIFSSSAGGDVEKSRTSFVWKYFTIMKRDDAEENAVVCNLCRVKFKTSTSTSSLAYHLLRMHQISPPAAAAKQEGGQGSGTGSIPITASASASGVTAGVKGAGKTGCTARGGGRGGGAGSSVGTAGQQGGTGLEVGLVAGEAEKLRYTAGARAAETNRHVLEYLVEDLLNPNVVAGTGFRELMRFLEPGYRLPDVPAFIGMINEEYATAKQALQKEIALVHQAGRCTSRTEPCFIAVGSNDNRGSKAQNASNGLSVPVLFSDATAASAAPDSVALSVELWRKPSSRTGSYLTVSAHYRSAAAGGAGGRPDQDLLKRVLATREVEYEASVEALVCTLKAIQNDWGLCKSLSHVVGPFGTTPNLNTAVQILGWRPVECFPTALSLCISQDGLYSVPEILSIILKCRALVEWYTARVEVGGACGVSSSPGCVLEGAGGDAPSTGIGNGPGIAAAVRGPLLRGGSGGMPLPEIQPVEWLEVARRAVEQMAVAEAEYEWRCWKASSVKQSALGGEQDDGGPVGGVDVCLRWRSIHVLLLAVIEFHGQLVAPLTEAGGADLLLTVDEQQLLLELVMFLKTFQDAADVLADSETSTISLVLPTLRALRRSCMRQSITGPMQSLRTNILFALERRFPENEVLLAATLLDLRFKHVVEKDRDWKISFLRKAITASKAVLSPGNDFCNVSTSEQILQQLQQPSGPASTSGNSTMAAPLSSASSGRGAPPDCPSGSSSGVTSLSMIVSSALNPSGCFASSLGAGTIAQGMTPSVTTTGVVSLPSVSAPAGNGVSGTGGRGVRTLAAATALGASSGVGGARGQRQRQQAGGSSSGSENLKAETQTAAQEAAQETKRRKLIDFYAILYEGEEELYRQEGGTAEGVGSRGPGPADEEENEAIREEVCRYLDGDCLRSRQMGTLSILQWWKINGIQFPRLARLALSLLIVPASSLGSEVIEDRRVNLESGLVDQLLFLNRNRRKE